MKLENISTRELMAEVRRRKRLTRKLPTELRLTCPDGHLGVRERSFRCIRCRWVCVNPEPLTPRAEMVEYIVDYATHDLVDSMCDALGVDRYDLYQEDTDRLIEPVLNAARSQLGRVPVDVLEVITDMLSMPTFWGRMGHRMRISNRRLWVDGEKMARQLAL